MIDPNAFSALPPLRAMLPWLQGQPAGRIIGRCLDATGCVLYRWLLAQGMQPVAVDDETITLRAKDGTSVMFSTPDDYREVMQRLDNLGGLPFTVTVQEVREVLRDVLAEYGEGVEGCAWERRVQ